MPQIEILDFDPPAPSDGVGFCMLFRTPPGGASPTVEVTAESGEVLPLQVVALGPGRDLWSAYLDDGIEIGDGYLKVRAGDCVSTGGTPSMT